MAFGADGAPKAKGHSMKGGHFFPEENPDDTAKALRDFSALRNADWKGGYAMKKQARKHRTRE